MNDHDIQLLAIGITIGIYVMLLVQVIGGVLDNRRDRKAIRAAKAQLEAAREKAST
jgi:F0F1-type ATP synthase membrane subunit b/b'